MVSAAVVAEVRARVAAGDRSTLAVDDLTDADLPRMTSWNSPTHLDSVAAALARVPGGEVEYLVVRAPGGVPVAKGGIDYVEHRRVHTDIEGRVVPYPEAGTIWQLGTHGDLRGLGLMTALMAEAERRIARRGLTLAVLGVEPDNARARRLYEHLGYQEFERDHSSWDQEMPDGTISRYETEIILMHKATNTG